MLMKYLLIYDWLLEAFKRPNMISLLDKFQWFSRNKWKNRAKAWQFRQFSSQKNTKNTIWSSTSSILTEDRESVVGIEYMMSHTCPNLLKKNKKIKKLKMNKKKALFQKGLIIKNPARLSLSKHKRCLPFERDVFFGKIRDDH